MHDKRYWVKVSRGVWKELFLLKIELGKKSLNDVIKELLEAYHRLKEPARGAEA